MRIDITPDIAALIPSDDGEDDEFDDDDGEGSVIGALALDPMGTTLAVGLSSHAARLLVYDLDARALSTHPLAAGYGGLLDGADLADRSDVDFGALHVYSCSFSERGRYLAAHHASVNNGNVYDHNLHIVDRETGKLALWLSPEEPEGRGLSLGVSAFAFRPGEAGVVTATFEGRISAWDFGPLPNERVLDDGGDEASALAVDARGSRLAVVRGGRLAIHDLGPGFPLLHAIDLVGSGADEGRWSAHFLGPRALVSFCGAGAAASFLVGEEGVRRVPGPPGARSVLGVSGASDSVLWECVERSPRGETRSLARQRLRDGSTRAVARARARGGESALAVSAGGARFARARGGVITIGNLRPKAR